MKDWSTSSKSVHTKGGTKKRKQFVIRLGSAGSLGTFARFLSRSCLNGLRARGACEDLKAERCRQREQEV